MAEADWDDMVLVGFIARTHGKRGEVILNSETDFPELRFRVGSTFYARQGAGPITTLEVTAVRFQQGRPILGLAGISSIGEAEGLAGTALKVHSSAQEPLPEGRYYHRQLMSCEVVTKSGELLGRVTDVQGDGAASRLVVRGARGEVQIPLAQEICDIQIADKRIVVDPPEGLLEVNGDWR